MPKPNKKQDKPGKNGKEPANMEPQRPAGRVVVANDGVRHTLRSDETLSSVAQKYGVSVQDIQQHNGITDPHKVYAGTVLRIPGQGGSQTVAASARPAAGGPDGRLGGKRDKDKPATSAKTEKAAKTMYTVQANDTLWKISRTYNVGVDDLKRWNSVDEKNLRTGARLVVEQ